MDFVWSFDLFFFSFPIFSFTLGERERKRDSFIHCLSFTCQPFLSKHVW
jgi:hypothetical protein